VIWNIKAVEDAIRDGELQIPVPADFADELTTAIRKDLPGLAVRIVDPHRRHEHHQRKTPSRIHRVLYWFRFFLGTCREVALWFWWDPTRVFRWIFGFRKAKTLSQAIRIKFDRERFLSVYETAALVAPKRSAKAILGNVKLEADQQHAILTATDWIVAIRLRMEGIHVESPGCVLLPVTRFGWILRESSDNELSVEAFHGLAHVRGLRSEFSLLCHNPDEYPSVAPFPRDGYQVVEAKLLKELSRRTLFATDTESTQWALAAVLLEMEGNRITAVATDGQRLAKMACAAECTDARTTVLVPARSLYLIERALTDTDAEIHIAARPDGILFRTSTETVTLYSRLGEGQFPEWRQLFAARKRAVRIEMTVGPTYLAIRQAAIVTDEENHAVQFAFGDNRLVLTCSTTGLGHARIELPVDHHGSRVNVTLDSRFVADFLRVLDPAQRFTMEVETENMAVVFTTDDGYCYVVMPLVGDG